MTNSQREERTIEVYGRDEADAIDAATSYARDDMGCALVLVQKVERKNDPTGKPYGPWDGRWIWRVTGQLQRLVGDASDPV